MQFSGIVPALQAGTYDYVAAPTTVTKERADNMLFTEGYLNTDFQFLIKKGAPKVEKLEDLKGKIVSVNKGSAYDSWARDLEAKIGWKVESFGTQTDAVQAVLAGRADANVAGNTVIAWAVKNNPQLELSYLHSTGLVWGAPLRKDSAELRKSIENAIECMKLDGTIAKMHEKWFGIKPAPGSAAVTVFPGYGVPGMAGYDPTEHMYKMTEPGTGRIAGEPLVLADRQRVGHDHFAGARFGQPVGGRIGEHAVGRGDDDIRWRRRPSAPRRPRRSCRRCRSCRRPGRRSGPRPRRRRGWRRPRWAPSGRGSCG